MVTTPSNLARAELSLRMLRRVARVVIRTGSLSIAQIQIMLS